MDNIAPILQPCCDTVSVLGQDQGYKVKYSPPPEGTSEGGGLYLTLYHELSSNMGK